MPRSCRCYDMGVASTPYVLCLRGQPAGLMWLAGQAVLLWPLRRLSLASAVERDAPMNRLSAGIVSWSGAGTLVPIAHAPVMLLTVIIRPRHVTSRGPGPR